MTKSFRKENLVLSFVNGMVIDLPSPSNLSNLWKFGFLSGLCLGIQIVTGIFLAMYYCADVSLAFSSVDYITRDVNFGVVIRYFHANGAHMFFLCVYIHMGRGIYYGSYSKRMLWNVGVLIYLLMMAAAFMGYVLPWGQMSFWAASVITGLLSAIPYIGEDVVRWVLGGFGVSNAVLTRFYSLHYLIPFILAGLMLVHLIALHEGGSGNLAGVRSDVDKIPFYPHYAIKDLWRGVVLIVGVFVFAGGFPYLLGDLENFKGADPLVTPEHIQPEWYFLFAYAILRSIPSKLGGVVALVSSLLVLFLVPFLSSSQRKGLRPLSRILFWFLVADFLLLTWLGMNPGEDPYIIVGGMASIFYFSYFLILSPGIWKISN